MQTNHEYSAIHSQKYALPSWLPGIAHEAFRATFSQNHRLLLLSCAIGLILSTTLVACGSEETLQEPVPSRSTTTRVASESTAESTATSPGASTSEQDGSSSETGSTPMPTAGDASPTTSTGDQPTKVPEQIASGPDTEALTAFYHATNGDSWENNENWLSSQPINTWHGVSVTDTGRVVALYLNSNRLTGKLPPQLADLENLTRINLSENELTGEIPAGLGDIEHLEILDLRQNQLTGEIPAGLGDIEHLEILDLSKNQLNGEIPRGFERSDTNRVDLTENPELCVPAPNSRLRARFSSSGICAAAGGVDVDREALVALYQATSGDTWVSADNWLSNQPFNTWLGVNTHPTGRVSHLRLVSNELNGAIPPEIGDLAHLVSLTLADSGLTGEIPPEIGDLTYLIRLNIVKTQLTGEIPSTLRNLKYLESLRLGDNQLNGGIPSWIGELQYLEDLHLSNNQFTGEIPPELGNLAPNQDGTHQGLENLDLSGNQLSGAIPQELTSLEGSINLFDNPLTGCLPTDWNARVQVQLLSCARGTKDTPDHWLKLLASKDEYGSDIYPVPEIVEHNTDLMTWAMIQHLVPWVKKEHPGSSGFYNDGQLGTIFASRIQLEWEPLWSKAPDLNTRVRVDFEWDTLDGPVDYRITAIGVMETIETSDRDWTRPYIDEYTRVPVFSHFADSLNVEKNSGN